MLRLRNKSSIGTPSSKTRGGVVVQPPSPLLSTRSTSSVVSLPPIVVESSPSSSASPKKLKETTTIKDTTSSGTPVKTLIDDNPTSTTSSTPSNKKEKNTETTTTSVDKIVNNVVVGGLGDHLYPPAATKNKDDLGGINNNSNNSNTVVNTSAVKKFLPPISPARSTLSTITSSSCCGSDEEEEEQEGRSGGSSLSSSSPSPSTSPPPSPDPTHLSSLDGQITPTNASTEDVVKLSENMRLSVTSTPNNGNTINTMMTAGNKSALSSSTTKATSTPTSTPSPSSSSTTAATTTGENGTKVWVKKTAIEAVRNPRLSFKEKMIGRKSSATMSSSGSGSFHGGNSSFHGNSSFSGHGSGSFHTTPKRQSSFTRQGSFTGSLASFSSNHDRSTTGGVGGRDLLDLSDSQSEIGSVGGAVWAHSSASSFFNNMNNSNNNNNTAMVANRSSEWGWMPAYMIDSSNGTITVQLAASEDEKDPSFPDLSSTSTSSSTTNGFGPSNPNISSNNNSGETVALPSTAMTDGDIVVANEYAIDEKDGTPICPDDLISLSHLHEPAVVECLQRRYDNDKIYTATGPVLLALNPFQNLRGLYSEATMKMYWERAENTSTSSSKKDDVLPPHVYAMADEAFRSMMRSLEQNLGTSTNASSDQSILVSGESGAGKTVTTKFVMKYLAALSQRAASNQSQPVERAYKKVEEKKAARSGTSRSTSTGVQSFVPKTTGSTPATPSWVKKKLNPTTSHSDSINGALEGRSEHSRTGGGNDALSNVTSLAGIGTSAMNSIEAQVLQSNPILESFGNARTMRNDNSSRFGKFIEIQFTRTGRLVGAQIETYLLEKVRLVTQSIGERNYHIFYEMLSGGMPADELRNYFIASTATADDFRMTASGTYDRRDGVTDKETYRSLRTAMKTMKFSEEEQQDVFATAGALLHASNLSFRDLGDQKSALDGQNVHLEPVCHLLGVTAEDLNQALCHFSITAGRESLVRQNLDVDRAEKGLEALLKTTYGALFSFLVMRINDSICFNPDDSSQEDSADGCSTPVPHSRKEKPAASIGVLDIFGFESFQRNSFEQLCINYCNEALQQQFNAFVLKNEQAEYEREGIEWSFIEFPENQDVLDLIDKRGSGILCILDDQCRAPGTSDRSFALDVYNKCKTHIRFSANRKQTAVLQFCVHHYAGPVEYSTDGFVEKNRDELPKEATELLQNSFNPFIRLMADIIESTAAERMANTNTPKVLRRQESNLGRATVGGQFRRQLKSLREKIDRMSPHYVRCLKPNDELVPNHFDRAAVAEQLRCGGILEAVRVARAGYSNHYSHEDFLRRYRCLGRNELKQAAIPDRSVGGTPTPQKKFGTAAVNAYLQNKATVAADPESPSRREGTSASAAASCQTLVKVLTKKLQKDKDDNDENEDNSNKYPTQSLNSPSTKKFQVSAAPPVWARGGGSLRSSRTVGLPPAPFNSSSKAKANTMSTWEKTTTDSRPPATPERSRRSFKNVGSASSSELARIGIQIGRTKVFLRHKAFEALERLRSQEQSRAAVKLNSVFRMYLARVAYVHVRNAVRKSMYDLRAYENDEFKECKDQSVDDERLLEFFNRLNKMRHSYGGESFSLVEVWANQMRESIHNPKPRSEWGKIDPSRPFKWMLVEGLWIKNHDFEE